MITARHINQNGLVALWEATDEGHSKVMLPSVDAAHALSTDPDRWSLVDPESPDTKPGERSASESGGETAL